ncbi:MAG: CRISPR-associated endonuclease Cas6 [Candidatus Aminicenantes bacterium]|nr:CRISPR-associated endonuclease Cas6 [Candidatus Aminicenantes bacterium]
MRVKTLMFSFKCNQPVKGKAEWLRGFFADQFREYVLIHHHLDDNKLNYSFPLIQYKILNEKPVVIGINEGTEVLQRLYPELSYIRLGSKEFQIIEQTLIIRTDDLTVTPEIKSYSFITPWLALNEKNYEKYQKFGILSKRKELLESILVGNILSMSKSLGYTVTEPIRAEINNFKEVFIRLKEVPMLGFLGTFSVNFEIPDYWGIGKSVSRGFGTIKKTDQ